MLTNIFIQAGVNTQTAEKASTLISSHEKKILAFSGKIASGKDTIGSALVKLLFADEYAQVSFATALKEEVQGIIAHISHHSTLNDLELAEHIADKLSASPEDITPIITWIRQDHKDYGEVSVYRKTPGVRRTVQHWGTDVRRKQNPQYWIDKTLQQIAELITQGKNVLITDARFPNELEAMNSIQACTIRLEVCPEVQKQRLMIRDGHDIIPAHESETALDDHIKDFHVVFSNNHKDIAPTVEALIPAVRGFYE